MFLKGGPQPTRYMALTLMGQAYGKRPLLAKRKVLNPRRRWQILPETPASLRIDLNFGRWEVPIPEAHCMLGTFWAGWSPCLFSLQGLFPSTLGPRGSFPSAYLLPFPMLGPGSFVGGGFPAWRLLCGVPPGWEELGSPQPARVHSGSWMAKGSGLGSGLSSPRSRKYAWVPSKSAPLPPR